MPEPRKTAFLIPHTHWDREWYRPFRVFQARLADVVDRVLALLEDPGYRRFTLDGQAVLLEDYLELRPERFGDLRRFVREGRLRVGPWYVLADEFLVSPEALVRNLMLGRAVCRRFGEPLPVAYTPDSFGHISQLPLLARGFGLESVVFQRGLGDEGERLRGEFRWRGADGETEVFAAHLIGTYSSVTALGHVDWELTDPYDPARAAGHLRAAVCGVQGDEVADLPLWFRASLERVRGGVMAYATGDALILLSGSDHLFPQENLLEILEDLRAALPDVDLVQGDVEDFVRAARASARTLEAYQGEFRGSRYHHLLSGVLSARLPLKRANDACETLLERYAEPLSALAWARGAPYPAALIQLAWKLLLHNHPHDSICGCSVDAVHREMATRSENVTQLGNDLCRRAFEAVADARPKNVQDVHAQPGSAVTVFNPLPAARRAAFTHRLELPLGAGEHLSVLGADGRPLPVQMDAQEAFAPGRSDVRVERLELTVLADLPPLGLSTFALARRTGALPETDLRVREDGGLVLENARLALRVAPDGTLRLTDRASGLSHPLTLALEDAGDAGDTYDFSPVPGDAPQVVRRPARTAELLSRGPVTATVRLEYLLELPERLADDRRTRVGRVALPCALDLTLTALSPVLGVRATFENTARDHRLRLVVGAGLRTDKVWAGGHFDALKRPVAPPTGEGWFQQPQGTNHFRRWLALSDGARGLAVFAKGLPEYEALPAETGTDLAVTLLRAVGWLSREDLLSRPQGAGPSLETPEAQCLGDHVCELALYPFAGDWWASDLLLEAQAFAAPPVAFAGGEPGQGAGLLELSGRLVLSAAKRAEDRDSLIVRVYNPAPAPAEGVLRLRVPVREVHRVRLDETRLEALPPETEISLRLQAKRVETLELVLEGGGDVTTSR